MRGRTSWAEASSSKKGSTLSSSPSSSSSYQLSMGMPFSSWYPNACAVQLVFGICVRPGLSLYAPSIAHMLGNGCDARWHGTIACTCSGGATGTISTTRMHVQCHEWSHVQNQFWLHKTADRSIFGSAVSYAVSATARVPRRTRVCTWRNRRSTWGELSIMTVSARSRPSMERSFR